MKNRYFHSSLYLSFFLIFVLSSCQEQRLQSEYFEYATISASLEFKTDLEQEPNFGVGLNVNNQRTNSIHTGLEKSKNFVNNQTDTLLVQDCGSFTVNHNTEDGVSPENKTIKYGSVVIGDQCWLDRNLGATKEAKFYYDDSIEAKGWYWQFNRKQGHRYDDDSLVPGFKETSIDEESDWVDSSDPCQLLIGEGWRLPTKDEVPVMSGNGLHLFESPLKLHAAGQFRSNGTFELPFWGAFWTRSEDDAEDEYGNPVFTVANTMRITNDGIVLGNRGKASGLSIRCTKNRDQEIEELPEVSTLKIKSVGAFQAHSKSFIQKDGGSSVSKRGICWSESPEPGLNDICTEDGWGSRMFRSYISELEPETLYFIRAYASNKTGIAFGEALSFETKSEDDLPEHTDCGSIKVNHSVDDGISPRTLEITYGTVEYDGACWIDRNLGAEIMPAYSSDKTGVSLGWYWQFNEKQGYRFEDNNSVPHWPEDYTFNNSDWETANDPCNNLLGDGWRIPNFDEFESFISKNQLELYNTPLRIHLNGSVLLDGSLNSTGFSGSYWSANQESYYGRTLHILAGKAREGSSNKSGGRGVRCINKKIDTSVHGNDQSIVPQKFMLHPNYPNPFNPITVIRYELPTNNRVSLSVYDLMGRRITTLVDERQQAGVHEVSWDASGVASGMYIYKLQSDELVQTRKMMLIK